MKHLKRRLLPTIIGIMLVLTFTFDAFIAYGRAPSHRSRGSHTSQAKTVRREPDRNNLAWDIKVKKQTYNQILKQLRKKKVRIDNNKAMVSRLRRVLGRLKRKALIPNLPYEVHYVDLDIVNAVCYPGGGILFFKGIFDSKKGLINPRNDNEIAAVMGHEIAHASLRHAYRRKKSAQTIGILGSIASVAIGSAAGNNWGNFFNAIYDAGTGLYFPSYSRKHEYEADLESVFMMKAAGYSPESAVDIWKRAAKKRGSKSSIYSTHPGSARRAKRLEKHLENIEKS